MFKSHAQLITSSWSTIEDGKQIKQWYPIVLLQYSNDEDETSFEIKSNACIDLPSPAVTPHTYNPTP